MPTLASFITSALYVTFVTASIGFGALYYRKVSDDLELRQVKLGEERYLLYDPKAFVGIGIFVFFFCIFVFILSLKSDLTHEEMNMSAPGLVLMVVPMVLLTNMIQLYLRARWQRLSVRTSGILIRRMLSDRRYELRFDLREVRVVVQRESLWFRLNFEDESGKTLTHCSLSARGLGLLLATIRRNTAWTLQSPDIDITDITNSDTFENS